MKNFFMFIWQNKELIHIFAVRLGNSAYRELNLETRIRGKVKYVTRSIWYEENKSDHWRSDVHAVRYTNTYAVLYNGDEVDIDEDDIRDYYDRSRITRDLVSELSDDLHNEWIGYYEDEDGDYCLDGELSDYI